MPHPCLELRLPCQSSWSTPLPCTSLLAPHLFIQTLEVKCVPKQAFEIHPKSPLLVFRLSSTDVHFSWARNLHRCLIFHHEVQFAIRCLFYPAFLSFLFANAFVCCCLPRSLKRPLNCWLYFQAGRTTGVVNGIRGAKERTLAFWRLWELFKYWE